MNPEDGLEYGDHSRGGTALEFQHGGTANYHFASGSLNSQARNKQNISVSVTASRKISHS
jgi:hypothetical protein